MASIGGWKAAGLAVSGAVSAGAGLLLVFKLVTPQAIAALGTIELVGLLLLLAMPAAVVWAYSRHAAETARIAVPAAVPAIENARPARAAPEAGATSMRKAA